MLPLSIIGLKRLFSLSLILIIPLFIFRFVCPVESGLRRVSPNKRVVAPSIEWKRPPDANERKDLEPWRKGVGPPVILGTPYRIQDVKRLDSLVIVSWNTNVGGGDLNIFIQDLRSGKLTSGTKVPKGTLL